MKIRTEKVLHLIYEGKEYWSFYVMYKKNWFSPWLKMPTASDNDYSYSFSFKEELDKFIDETCKSKHSILAWLDKCESTKILKEKAKEEEKKRKEDMYRPQVILNYKL